MYGYETQNKHLCKAVADLHRRENSTEEGPERYGEEFKTEMSKGVGEHGGRLMDLPEKIGMQARTSR